MKIGDAYFRDSAMQQLEWSKSKLQELLENYSLHSLKVITKQLVVKDIILDPIKVKVLFEPPVIGGLVEIFKLLTETLEQLRVQGIYLPYLGDQITQDRGIVHITKSKHHPLGTIPITRHNVLGRWRYLQDGTPTGNLTYHLNVTARAKEIFDRWEGRPSWVEWGKGTEAYEIAALELAKEDLDAAELQLVDWDLIRASV